MVYAGKKYYIHKLINSSQRKQKKERF